MMEELLQKSAQLKQSELIFQNVNDALVLHDKRKYDCFKTIVKINIKFHLLGEGETSMAFSSVASFT